MKTLPFVVKSLIKINIATAIASTLIFAMLRSQQAQLTGPNQDRLEQSKTYHTAVKAQTTAEQVQLETSYQKIARNEQEIKKLEQELETYKTQIKDLLLDDNAQASSTQNTNYSSDNAKRNLSSRNLQNASLLNQIVKSGQTNPSEATVKVIESSSKIERAKNSSREKSITQNKNPQIQSALPASARSTQSFTPSTNLYYPSQTIQASKPKSSNTAEIKLDSRALFSTQSPQKPLDSFITPTNADSYKDQELKNRTVLMAQQLSKKVYPNYLANSVNQSGSQLNQHIAHANDIVVGLMVADEKNQINYGTKTYKQVQTAIRALRGGKNINDAARLANLTPSVLNQLIKWGENRPGNLSELSEISKVSPDVQ